MTDASEATGAAGRAREAALRARADPRRARWGIVHTPLPVARWALSKVDACLREQLGLAGGLADPRAGLLDVSVGTGVWLATALELAAGRASAPAACVGLDVDGEALDVARRTLRPVATAAGWPLSLRRCNTLSLRRPPWPASPPQVPVLFGNPPWASRSESRRLEPTESWLDDFRRGPDGAPLAERRLGVLSDDYVRFLRWAAEQTRHAPSSLVCLATNGSFLDGPVHRGMRARLLSWFDAIEVLDLGGNALLSRREVPDGNVFGVRTGAAVTLLYRAPSQRREGAQDQSPGCPLRYGRLSGRVSDKLAALQRGPVLTPLPGSEPGAPWLPLARGTAEAWPEGSVELERAMPFHREGVQTNRDDFAIAPSHEELLARMQAFAAGAEGPPARPHFDVAVARDRLREALRRDPGGRDWIVPLCYRPFDTRYVVAIAPVCHRPRAALLRAATPATPSLLTARKDRGGRAWCLFAPGMGAADACFLSTRSSCRTRQFPARDPQGQPNLDRAVIDAWLDGRLGARERRALDASALIHYALGLLATGAYRERFDGLLRRGYPRLLAPASAAAFAAVCATGRALADAMYGPVREMPSEGTPPSQGVGHFTAEVLCRGGDPRLRARLQRYERALVGAERHVRDGAFVGLPPPR